MTTIKNLAIKTLDYVITSKKMTYHEAVDYIVNRYPQIPRTDLQVGYASWLIQEAKVRNRKWMQGMTDISCCSYYAKFGNNIIVYAMREACISVGVYYHYTIFQGNKPISGCLYPHQNYDDMNEYLVNLEDFIING